MNIRRPCFPRLYAAASLKGREAAAALSLEPEFSAALCRGLIEGEWRILPVPWDTPFSAALCRGLIEGPS